MTHICLELVATDAAKAVQRRDVVIVIDVLRCTSTIVTALASGAAAIMPVRDVERARSIKLANPEYILAGERGGLKPSGFEMGNSPLEYMPEHIRDRRIILTTSSGTEAIERVRDSPAVLVGSFLNLSAVTMAAKRLSKQMSQNITVALAGRLGEFSLEDFLCGGATVEHLKEEADECSDSAYAAYLSYRACKNNLLQCVLKGKHARNLVDLGLLMDVEFCCMLDRYDTVPLLKEGWIVKAA